MSVPTNTVTTERWTELAEASCGTDVAKPSDLDTSATPCPAWCATPRHHTVKRRRADRRHQSAAVSVSLQNHLGSDWDDDTGEMNLPIAEVTILQGFGAVRPVIRLRRWAFQNHLGDIGVTEGSEFTFSLDEAAELGRLLLGAVDATAGLNEKAAK